MRCFLGSDRATALLAMQSSTLKVSSTIKLSFKAAVSGLFPLQHSPAVAFAARCHNRAPRRQFAPLPAVASAVKARIARRR